MEGSALTSSPSKRASTPSAKGHRRALSKATAIFARKPAEMGKAALRRDIGHALLCLWSSESLAEFLEAGLAQVPHGRGASEVAEVLE